MKTQHTAAASETQFAGTNGRTLAYRSIGQGQPIILTNRFRGTLDTWDPLFLDGLAKKYRVITFDYTGIGSSTGTLPADITLVTKDVKDLADALHLKQVIVMGWSYGGTVAQAAALDFPELISHAILIGTNPAGQNAHQFEPVFLERALKPVNDFADEIILFFEPKSEASIGAAKASHERIAERLDVPKIPASAELYNLYFTGVGTFQEDKSNYRQRLTETKTPLLVISGDHDPSCPVENWLTLVRQLPTAQMIVYPHTGHGPQHQFPELTVNYIDNFIAHTNKN